MKDISLSHILNSPLCANANEGFLWLQQFYNSEQKSTYNQNIYRLDRMKSLLAHFKNPHLTIPAIHIAGSKGKGSTAAYCASILAVYNFKVGLYTSPHICSYKERITCNNIFFPDEIYCSQIQKIQKELPSFIKGQNSSIPLIPTLFELLTLLAFLVFNQANCDVAVIEVGLGGRLDATNCIVPLLSIITQIEKEHTAYLGNSLKKIATQKAGIIKESRPFLLTKQKHVVTKTFIKTANRLSAPIYTTQEQLKKYNIDLTLIKKWNLPVPGEVQKENVKNAIAAATIFLPLLNCTINTEKLKNAIEATRLKGRMEKISTNPNIWIDGAHTPLSFKNGTTTFKKLCETKKCALVFSALQDKAIKKMIKIALDNFDIIYFSSIDSFRKQEPKTLYQIASRIRKQKALFNRHYRELKLYLCHSSYEATTKAKESGCDIFVSGSFYLVSEVVKGLRSKNKMD